MGKGLAQSHMTRPREPGQAAATWPAKCPVATSGERWGLGGTELSRQGSAHDTSPPGRPLPGPSVEVRSPGDAGETTWLPHLCPLSSLAAASPDDKDTPKP